MTRRAGGTTVLALAGELDLYRVPGARAGAPRRSGETPPGEGAASFDLRAVTFLDSGTLALLLAAHGRQEARDGELLILVGPHTPMTVFEVTGFDRLLTIRHVRGRRAA